LKDSDLTVNDHSRDSAGLRYVYAVVSRRAQGVSVGINLNTNNACNWRCIYCQVPNLTRGTAPPVDMALLESELRGFLEEVLHGDFMRRVPEGMRRINDIAISGNGEPTSAEGFADVIDLVCRVKQELDLPAETKLVLITNGSLMQRENVQRGLRRMAQLNGEVWFKLDRASEVGMQLVNDTHMSLDRVRENLRIAISCCANTWLQTCWFELDGTPPSMQDEDDYIGFLTNLLRDDIRPRGVLLYSLARPSLQPEASRLTAIPEEQLEVFAARIRALGLVVQVNG
jgi:wyosine [tRNA(Phe)-imidazoG37] synthetase (radical SAM superfamily)